LNSDRDEAAGSSGSTDPGIRLLSRIGAFVEPLTRFDRGHLTLQNSEHAHVEITARQTFRVVFGSSAKSGSGGLPSGVVQVDDAHALAHESQAQLATSQASAPGRVAAWAQQHGENPAQRPAVNDVFTPMPPLGFVKSCATCAGNGEVTCGGCNGARALTCSGCGGSGSLVCNRCGGGGRQTCSTCGGAGYRVYDRQKSYHDSASNSTQYRTVQDRQTCSCSGGRVTCNGCGGSGRNTCASCGGNGKVNCSQCAGRGVETCRACEGKGKHFHVAQLSCAITETLEISPRTSDADVLDVLGKLTTIESLLAYSETHRATAETNADTMRRNTITITPVTTVEIAIGDQVARIRGYGPAQDIRDFANVAGLLLAGDLDRLEAALPATRAFPPSTTPEMAFALADVLASEVNVAIAQQAARKDMSGLAREFHGVVSDAFVTRSARAMRTGIERTYWSSMLQGPAALLALPLLQILVQFLVRGQDAGSQVSAMLGVMLLAFGGTIGAHLWCVRLVQQRLRPNGVPRMSGLINKLHLTTLWLAGAAVWCVGATHAVSALATVLLPCSLRVAPAFGPAVCLIP